ncbi:MAG: VWA domain-containing protein, partial [Phaeodactylibacter sp.]|nr:VWA domain-containing protein [Phaeodactylibacter sp.]
PYDDKITQLNLRLNATYLAYGAEGQEYKTNQMVQDQNALKYSTANVADRAVFKSSANYSNEKWDLVDAYKRDKKILIRERENMPDSLKQLSRDELENEIQQLAQERESINQEIRELGEKRRAYLEAETEKDTAKTENSLGASILKALREQAKKKGFVIE